MQNASQKSLGWDKNKEVRGDKTRLHLLKTVMLVLGLGLKAKFFGLGLETKSLALALCPQVLVVLNIVQV